MIRALLPASLVLLTACAGDAGAGGPSLLPRPVEQQTFEEPAPAAATPVLPDPALDSAIAGMVARRTASSAAFAAADRRIAAALAAGSRAAVGSDAWLDAQTALAALDEERASILAVLSELEQLAIARATEGRPPYPALEATLTDTRAEAERIAALAARRKAALPL